MSRPDDVLYTRTHEWARFEGDLVIVGITDHAVEQLGDLAFVDLPAAGAKVERGARFGEIESTKTVSDLLAPVSGEIVEVNGELAEDVERIQESPFENGWIVKIRAADPSDRSELLDATGYRSHIESEES